MSSHLRPCGAHGDCVNLPGSHQCTCHPGFHKMVRKFLANSKLLKSTNGYKKFTNKTLSCCQLHKNQYFEGVWRMWRPWRVFFIALPRRLISICLLRKELFTFWCATAGPEVASFSDGHSAQCQIYSINKSHIRAHHVPRHAIAILVFNHQWIVYIRLFAMVQIWPIFSCSYLVILGTIDQKYLTIYKYSGSCTNLPGTFECSCEQGWRLENITILVFSRLNHDTRKSSSPDWTVTHLNARISTSVPLRTVAAITPV